MQPSLTHPALKDVSCFRVSLLLLLSSSFFLLPSVKFRVNPWQIFCFLARPSLTLSAQKENVGI